VIRGGDRCRERVEVDHHQIDRREVRLLEFRHLRGAIAARQNAPEHVRMERLDPAPEHLRTAGKILDLHHLEAGFGKVAGGAAGGHQPDSVFCQGRRELHQTRLVIDGQ